jgi:hypothetical protein
MTLLVACTATPATQVPSTATKEPPRSQVTIAVTKPAEITQTSLPSPAATSPVAERNAAEWKTWPVIPSLRPEMLELYRQGQDLKRDAHTISVVGDCESSSDWFLKDFSKGDRYYNLGPYGDLQETIDYFNPSLGFRSYAALRGATATTVLTALWADPKNCDKGETPLGCEYRVHNPAFAIIALGTNDINKLDQFKPKMHEIIEYTLSKNIIPILVTKADNLEGDESINMAIAEFAVEYHLPVWNFWAAVQSLPGQGLQEDGAHLTFASNFFNDPEKLQRAWPVRNLTALQVLESIRLAVQE